MCRAHLEIAIVNPSDFSLLNNNNSSSLRMALSEVCVYFLYCCCLDVIIVDLFPPLSLVECWQEAPHIQGKVILVYTLPSESFSMNVDNGMSLRRTEPVGTEYKVHGQY